MARKFPRLHWIRIGVAQWQTDFVGWRTVFLSRVFGEGLSGMGENLAKYQRFSLSVINCACGTMKTGGGGNLKNLVFSRSPRYVKPSMMWGLGVAENPQSRIRLSPGKFGFMFGHLDRIDSQLRRIYLAKDENIW